MSPEPQIVKRREDQTVATRFASLLHHICWKNPGVAIPVNFRALAWTLRCDRDYCRKISMRVRIRAWSFQGYGIMLFVRYKRHQRARCGHPQVYALNWHYVDTIGGSGTRRTRWHLRKPSVEEWNAYLDRIINLKFARIFRRRKTADGTDKGSDPPEKDRKIRRQKANRPRWRVFLRLADAFSQDFAIKFPDESVNLRGWAARRLSDGHDYARMLESLAHAVKTLYRHHSARLPWVPVNRNGWLCATATNTLEYDGLTPFIRWRERRRKQKRHAEAFKEEGRKLAKASLERLAEFDRQREKLRERKILPDGSEIEYDPRLGYWLDVPAGKE